MEKHQDEDRNLNEFAQNMKKQLRINTGTINPMIVYVNDVIYFIKKAVPNLEKIGKELGRSDDYYLQLVQAVYHVCQEKIVKQVNEGQEILLQDQYDHIRTSAFKTLITKAFECSSYLSELELSYDVKKDIEKIIMR